MQYIRSRIEDIKSLSLEDKLILFVAFALFLPMYASTICIASVTIYALFKKNLISSIKHQIGAKFLYAFCLLEIVVSLFYANSIGVINALGMLLIGAYVAYYRDHISSKVFDLMIEMILLLSLIITAFGLFEFNYYSQLADHSFFDFYVQNKPSRRIHVTFLNANIYATMIEFFVVCCLYKWVSCSSLKEKAFYVFCGVVNLIMLYLTGCRTAFIPLALVVPVFFICYGERKWILLSIGLFLAGIIAVLLIPDLIPRLSDISTLESRFDIWYGAFQGIAMYPLFGNGPQTYGRLYPIYGWHKAPHAHNIYIDAISSYGIIGTVLLVGYYVYLGKEMMQVRKHKALFGMMVSFVLVYLIHGLLDCTLNALWTGMLFFVVLNTGAMYRKEN